MARAMHHRRSSAAGKWRKMRKRARIQPASGPIYEKPSMSPASYRPSSLQQRERERESERRAISHFFPLDLISSSTTSGRMDTRNPRRSRALDPRASCRAVRARRERERENTFARRKPRRFPRVPRARINLSVAEGAEAPSRAEVNPRTRTRSTRSVKITLVRGLAAPVPGPLSGPFRSFRSFRRGERARHVHGSSAPRAPSDSPVRRATIGPFDGSRHEAARGSLSLLLVTFIVVTQLAARRLPLTPPRSLLLPPPRRKTKCAGR